MIRVSWGDPSTIEHPDTCTVELDRRVDAARDVAPISQRNTLAAGLLARLACWFDMHDWRQVEVFESEPGAPFSLGGRMGFVRGCKIIGEECASCGSRDLYFAGSALYVPDEKISMALGRARKWQSGQAKTRRPGGAAK